MRKTPYLNICPFPSSTTFSFWPKAMPQRPYSPPGDHVKMPILSQVGPRFCISNKLPGEAHELLVPGHTLSNKNLNFL